MLRFFRKKLEKSKKKIKKARSPVSVERAFLGFSIGMELDRGCEISSPIALEDWPVEETKLETGQTLPFEKSQSEKELEHLGRLGKYEIAPQTGRRLIKKYGWERIDANLKDISSYTGLDVFFSV